VVIISNVCVNRMAGVQHGTYVKGKGLQHERFVERVELWAGSTQPREYN
jgi:hypothetical protein